MKTVVSWTCITRLEPFGWFITMFFCCMLAVRRMHIIFWAMGSYCRTAKCQSCTIRTPLRITFVAVVEDKWSHRRQGMDRWRCRFYTSARVSHCRSQMTKCQWNLIKHSRLRRIKFTIVRDRGSHRSLCRLHTCARMSQCRGQTAKSRWHLIKHLRLRLCCRVSTTYTLVLILSRTRSGRYLVGWGWFGVMVTVTDPANNHLQGVPCETTAVIAEIFFFIKCHIFHHLVCLCLCV